ncbi:hypothetical protein DL764_006766 [Monosporascus ibericus]|uniref:Uncharacterized protein n=1 Tax=Monosporascus ibericus TaxID=155417 RepID=A0A4Q4T5W9_9PEZI|nr:hypothetical protein DL764_006766 [Monosporascus ibericus]
MNSSNKCISINDITLRSPDKKANAKDLIKVIEDLSAVLDGQIAKDASVLDEKLADYVFFPLSNVLRNQQQYPIRLTEVTIKCLRNLVQYGWKSKTPPDLAQQLLILLTFIIGGVPGQDRKDQIPEETELEAFKALSALTRSLASSATGAAALVDAKSIPALGHIVSVVLDGITDGRTNEIQLEALQALDALREAVKDRAALATFLPGLISSLSRLLAPPKSLKTQRRVLVKGISAVKDVLVKVLGDVQVMGILKKQEASSSDANVEGKVLTNSWLKATAAKVKLALASILKLRNHDSDDVRSVLRRLCLTLLDECHQSLSEAVSILVESAMILSDDDEERSAFETSLTDLARVYPELGDTIKNTVYNWVTSMPRLIQAGEEKTKQQAIQNLLKGLHFVNTLQLDSSTLENTLATSLRDSGTVLLLGSKPSAVLSELSINSLELHTADVVKRNEAIVFRPVVMGQENERSTRAAILDLVANIGTTLQRNRLASDMLNHTQESTGPGQVASYWLAFELVKSIYSQSSEIDEFIDFTSSAGPPDETDFVSQALYSFSVTILDSHAEADEIDWRLQALALEVTTFTASRLRMSFQPELIDVLYPIATFMGSDNHHLRDHAIVSLNSIAISCGYSNVTDLIIDNVDYMVNSVSLRLNTFDISPASTQVLRMMIRLTGPKLIPYLDDVVASIFAALDNYHGYPIFVESLFSVLIEVVHQGAGSDQLLFEEAKSSKMDHKKSLSQTISTKGVVDILSERLERKRKRQQEDIGVGDTEPHPKRPWEVTKTAAELLEEVGQGPDEDPEEHSQAVEEQPPPKTPTFQILSRITNLTQHYLTSPSPTLRKSLLDLLSIVCPALSPDEETFLPLVNSIWPVLVERLYDPEAFVAISACKALSALCRSAGDFLSTRIKTEWWDNLGKWCKKTKSEAAQLRGKARAKFTDTSDNNHERGIIIPVLVGNDMETIKLGAALETVSNTGLGRFTQASQTWEAAQDLLVSIVSFVRIDDDILEQILRLLADTLASNHGIRSALEAIDADAVWLLMYQEGCMQPSPQPVMVGTKFVNLS